MVYLPSFNSYRQYLAGSGPDPFASMPQSIPIAGASPSSGDSGGVASPGVAPQTSIGHQELPSSIRTALGSSVSTTDPSTLFNPVQQGVQQQQTALNTTQQSFNTAAGPSRTFEGIQALPTLQKALTPTATTADLSAGKGLVNSQYSGPTELDPTQIQNIQKAIGSLQQQGNALTSQTGTQALIQKAHPTLTPGELRMESSLLTRAPEFKQQAAQQQESVNSLANQFGAAQTQATQKAAQRATEESSIAQQAKDYLTGQQTSMEGALDQNVAQKQQANQALIDAYTQFQKTGTLQDLGAIPEANRASYVPADSKSGEAVQWSPEQLANTPITQQATQARQIGEGIINKYTDIKDLPPLQLGIDKKGREVFVPGDPNKKQSDYTAAQWTRLVQRQQELENAGFNPGRSSGRTPGALAPFSGLYYGQQYQAPDTRNYTKLTFGIDPSRENVSTEDQRTVYNHISDMMDTVNRLEKADQPFQAAQVAMNVDRLIADQEQGLKDAETGQHNASTGWISQVVDARKSYKKMEKRAKFAKIARIINGVLSLGSSEVLRLDNSGFTKPARGLETSEGTGGAKQPLFS